MIYGRAPENCTDDTDATRMLGTHFAHLWITSGYMSVTTHSSAETFQDKPGLHRDAPGRLKVTPDGFADFADSHGRG